MRIPAYLIDKQAADSVRFLPHPGTMLRKSGRPDLRCGSSTSGLPGVQAIIFIVADYRRNLLLLPTLLR